MSDAIEVGLDYEAALESETVEQVLSWRNSLFCVSETLPHMYLAIGDDILVYDMKDAVSDCFDALTKKRQVANHRLAPVQVLAGLPARLRPRRPYGAQPGIFDGPAINVLQTFMLRHEEVLVSGDGLGRIIIRYVKDSTRRPICYNVGSSVWGIDMKGRYLAASANSHKVYLIDLQETSTSIDHEDQLMEVRTLHDARANIPSVSISPDATFVAAVDIAGELRSWTKARPGSEFENRSNSCVQLPSASMGWGCCILHEESFRTIATDTCPNDGEVQAGPTLIRSLHPKLGWWRAMGFNVIVDLDPEGPGTPGMTRPSIHIFWPFPRQTFEICWRRKEVQEFRKYMKMNEGERCEDLVLVTSVDSIVLVCHSEVQAICDYPFGAKCFLEHEMERINHVRALPECGMVVVGTQRGHVCLLELIKSVQIRADGMYASFSFRCHDLDYPAFDFDQSDELIGLDLKRISASEARMSVLHRSGNLRAMRIAVNDAREHVHIADVTI